VLNEAVAAGGSSLRPMCRPDGELGYFQHKWRVYEKEGQDWPRIAPARSAASCKAGAALSIALRSPAMTI